MKESTKIKLQAGAARALRTFGQSTLAAFGVTGTVSISNAQGITWPAILAALSTGAIAAILSILMSLQTLPEVKDAVEEAKADEQKVADAIQTAKVEAEKAIIVEKAVAAAAQAKVDEGLEQAKEEVKEEVVAKIEAEEIIQAQSETATEPISEDWDLDITDEDVHEQLFMRSDEQQEV